MPNVSDNCELELGAGAGDVARVVAVPGSQGLSNKLLVVKQTADDASSKLMRAVQSSKLGGKLSGAVGKVGSSSQPPGGNGVRLDGSTSSPVDPSEAGMDMDTADGYEPAGS